MATFHLRSPDAGYTGHRNSSLILHKEIIAEALPVANSLPCLSICW